MSKRRYFEEDLKSKPGVISEQLRKACGIAPNRLPIWIYRMRVLGYPPGWLKDAQINTLTLFDGSNGDKSKNNDCEDGEIGGVQYNKESFIEYPGFNVALPKGVSDDWYELRMPPMLPQQQLKEALKTMKVTEPVPYKRRKAEPNLSSSLNESNNSSALSSPVFSRSQSMNDSSITTISSLDANKSITENDLSLKELDKSSTNETVDCVNNVWEDIEICESKSINKSDISVESPQVVNTSVEQKRKLKLVSMGSPMPVSSNPKRPSLEKWSKDMGELLYFENLPTSTGVYQNKMKGVIEKIRQKTAQS